MSGRKNGVRRHQGHLYNEVDHVFMVMEDWPCQRNVRSGNGLCGGANADRARWNARSDGAQRSGSAALSPESGMHGPMHERMMQMMHGGQRDAGGMRHGMGQQSGMSGQPTMPGQDAFGTIQEVVQILEADPSTDWSKVNIAALREHLIDMNEVTLHAAATEQALENGVEIAVTGEGRTLAAIKRMVPAHVANSSSWAGTPRPKTRRMA